MHTSVIEVAAPAWPVPVQEPKYARELRRVALDLRWRQLIREWVLPGEWEKGTQVVMLNDATKIAEELQSRADMLARRVAELERDNASLHREKIRLQDEVDEARHEAASAGQLAAERQQMLASAREQIEDVTQERVEAVASIHGLTNERNELSDKLVAAETELDKARKDLLQTVSDFMRFLPRSATANQFPDRLYN